MGEAFEKGIEFFARGQGVAQVELDDLVGGDGCCDGEVTRRRFTADDLTN